MSGFDKIYQNSMMTLTMISSFIICVPPSLSFVFLLSLFQRHTGIPSRKLGKERKFHLKSSLGFGVGVHKPTSAGELDPLGLEICTYLAVENAAAKRVTWKIGGSCWKPLITQATNRTIPPSHNSIGTNTFSYIYE